MRIVSTRGCSICFHIHCPRLQCSTTAHTFCFGTVYDLEQVGHLPRALSPVSTARCWFASRDLKLPLWSLSLIGFVSECREGWVALAFAAIHVEDKRRDQHCDENRDGDDGPRPGRDHLVGGAGIVRGLNSENSQCGPW